MSLDALRKVIKCSSNVRSKSWVVSKYIYLLSFNPAEVLSFSIFLNTHVFLLNRSTVVLTLPMLENFITCDLGQVLIN